MRVEGDVAWRARPRPRTGARRVRGALRAARRACPRERGASVASSPQSRISSSRRRTRDRPAARTPRGRPSRRPPVASTRCGVAKGRRSAGGPRPAPRPRPRARARRRAAGSGGRRDSPQAAARARGPAPGDPWRSTSTAPRLEQEIAMFAERSDICEELTRLESHCRPVRGTRSVSDEAVGRRLDFLLARDGARGQHRGSQEPRRADCARHRRGEGRDRADARAGAERRMNPYDDFLARSSCRRPAAPERRPSRACCSSAARSCASASRTRRAPRARTRSTAGDYHFVDRARFMELVDEGRLPRVGRGARQPLRHFDGRDRASARHARAAPG